MLPLRYHSVRVLSRRREIDVLANRAGIQEVSLRRLGSRLPLDVTSSLMWYTCATGQDCALRFSRTVADHRCGSGPAIEVTNALEASSKTEDVPRVTQSFM